jgi:heat shock protein beta
MAEEDNEKFEKLVEVYGSVFKLGAVEDLKNREKLTALTRFTTNQRNYTSLDQVCPNELFYLPFIHVLQYLENKKQGQKQVRFRGLLSELYKIYPVS